VRLAATLGRRRWRPVVHPGRHRWRPELKGRDQLSLQFVADGCAI